MKTREHKTRAALDIRLRRAAPPLRAPRTTAVDAACARLAAEPTPRRAPAARSRRQPPWRAAAGLALLAGAAWLLRSRPHPSAAGPQSTESAPWSLTVLLGTEALEEHLSREAANLAADLADLTHSLNDRSLSILF